MLKFSKKAIVMTHKILTHFFLKKIIRHYTLIIRTIAKKIFLYKK